jgi:MFS family permease
MFPIKQQLRRIYAYSFASCLRITDAVWVVLLVARGFALWQVGLAEGIFHIVSLTCEIPSGMAADLLGRRRTLAVSGVVGAASALTMALSGSFVWVCLAMALSALSYNLISGTQEAITYDSLVAVRQEKNYLQVDANSCQLQTLGSAVSDLFSLLSGVLNYVGFYLLDACIALSRTGVALGLREPVVTEKQAHRGEHSLRELGARMWEQAATAGRFLQENHGVLNKILANAVAGLPCYLTLMFLQQRLTELGFPTMLIGVPFLAAQLCGMLGTAIGRRMHHVRLRALYVGCALAIGAGTVCAGAAPILPAILGSAAVAAANNIWMLHVEKNLNDAYPSDQRATLVSVDSMAYSILMIVASPLTGAISDAAGNAGTGLVVLGFVVAAAGGMAAFFQVCRHFARQ